MKTSNSTMVDLGHRLQKVVTLSPEEEAEYERLLKEKGAAEREHHRLSLIATEAVKQRNSAGRKAKALVSKWLPLAERKFPR